ncbi:hypothetical protein DENIS_4030 [Desulfonema ishimotonii]|uniref:Uncharacterized protein n=1 Tax=Desulfonema ishimotonii TaxID=45657 RepID=A0A401G1F6_9BACT|nr:hypothetical protein [Desulfonema ishimotonii]GBC63041.1 hypothetical protein DENIS_4030 [Desulfonema ishimotonii]
MKQYVIDELRLEDYDTLRTCLDEHFGDSGVGGLYWIPLDADILSEIQAEHTACQPFYFAAELEEDRLSFELLVRTRNHMRCDCMAYATPVQRNWLVEQIDAILEKLNISI